MIEIKIPEDKELAAAIGEALMKWSGVKPEPVIEQPVQVTPASVLEEAVQAEVEMKPSVFDEVEEDEEEEEHPEEDVKGVPFDPDYCDPEVLKGGARKGCWKAKKGVSQKKFKEWYAEHDEEAIVPSIEPSPEVDEEKDEQLRKAFATPNNPDPLLPPVDSDVTERPQPEAPKTCPELLSWVSEQQASGFLEAKDVTEAYMATGIQVRDMFPPVPADQVAVNVGILFQYLQGVAKSVQ